MTTRRQSLILLAAAGFALTGCTGARLPATARLPRPERLYVEDSLKDAFPGLELLRLERRQRRVGDGAVPLLDVVAWAVRSLREEGSQ